MGPFAAGQVVIVHFPFSDLSASKLRPAVVLAEAGRGDWILWQIFFCAPPIHCCCCRAEKLFSEILEKRPMEERSNGGALREDVRNPRKMDASIARISNMISS